MNLSENYKNKLSRLAGIKESRELGKRMSEITRNPYVTVYRAVKNGVEEFYDKDYVTLSKKFAIEHAENNHIVYDEPYQVIKALISTNNIYEATNPGEYLYSGAPKKGVIEYITKGYDYEGWDDENVN
jgi:hypothetical protein